MDQGGGLWVVIAMIITVRLVSSLPCQAIAAVAKRECDTTMFALILLLDRAGLIYTGQRGLIYMHVCTHVWHRALYSRVWMCDHTSVCLCTV